MIELRPAEASYPRRLLDLPAPPDPLWVRGELPPERVRTVGIVGTRRMTEYGARVAREIAHGVAAAGAVVVSGLAQGIDSIAHQAALDAGGRTIAVLGEGILSYERFGPYRRRRLAGAIHRQGALVSEYALDMAPKDWTYPRRNATLAALSDVVVVIEAPRGSGALITAERARELGRPLYAVPGPIGASTWEGSNEWIARRRASVLLSCDPVLRRLRLRASGEAPTAVADAVVDRALDILASGAGDADAIAAPLGLSPGDAATLIADLLLAGRIVPTGDGRFARA